MSLKDKIGLAVNQCATSQGLIEGASLYVTKGGVIKKELGRKDEEHAHIFVKNGKLNVDYADKPKKEESKPKASTKIKSESAS